MKREAIGGQDDSLYSADVDLFVPSPFPNLIDMKTITVMWWMKKNEVVYSAVPKFQFLLQMLCY